MYISIQAGELEKEEDEARKIMMEKFVINEDIIDFSIEENKFKNDKDNITNAYKNKVDNDHQGNDINDNKNVYNDDNNTNNYQKKHIENEEIVRMMETMNAELELKSKNYHNINNDTKPNDNNTTKKIDIDINDDRNNNKNTNTSSWSRRIPSIPLPSIPLPSIPFRTKLNENDEHEKQEKIKLEKEKEKEKKAVFTRERQAYIDKQEHLRNIQNTIDDKNVSIITKYWNWPEYSASSLYDLHLLKWETQLQIELGKICEKCIYIYIFISTHFNICTLLLIHMPVYFFMYISTYVYSYICVNMNFIYILT
jgi:hypothetical protein